LFVVQVGAALFLFIVVAAFRQQAKMAAGITADTDDVNVRTALHAFDVFRARILMVDVCGIGHTSPLGSRMISTLCCFVSATLSAQSVASASI
jgi:hypothetical protein